MNLTLFILFSNKIFRKKGIFFISFINEAVRNFLVGFSKIKKNILHK